MCPFQALLLLQAGSNLAADQAIKHTFINSGLSCLAITSNLVPDTEGLPPPHVPLWHEDLLLGTGEDAIQLEAVFNKHDGVEMA